jgi:alkylated DNA repair dioxygenase AlkB
MDLFDDNDVAPFELPNKDGYSITWNENSNGFDIKIPHGELFYSESFFSKKISDRSVEYFLENDDNDWHTADWRSCEKEKLSEIKFKNIDWHHDKIKMYGKDIYLPRYSAWYGDSDKPYTYSGLTLQPKKWNKGLLYLKSEIYKVSGVNFNSVLMNWYRDGEDYINWHTDAEKVLGKNPVIGSVNFGETRDFVIRMNDKSDKITIPLKHGTFLLMSGEMQHHWQHSLPKRKKVKGSRFNLTFRIIKPDLV